MKFSEKWLREIVNPSVNTDILLDQLTMSGLEVDDITKMYADFEGLFIAEVKSVKKHPNADNLHICDVDCGEKDYLTIVCGAPNVAPGMRTVLAKVGAQLPDKPKLKRIKLKGIESCGMLCSASEIGLGENNDGIIDLPPDEPIGKSLKDILKIDDNAIEISLTPNRGDCLSIYGVAREVAASNKIDIKDFTVKTTQVTTKNTRTVRITAKSECPRYLCRIIENIDSSIKSPLWLTEKLRCSGIRSVNVVVDITNYVMLELGQPLHAFDNDRLNGDIEVRFPTDNEKLKLLDETEVKINTGTLLISDASGPLALAGLMGGFDTAVTDSTENILLESAFFKPEIILGQARQYGLNTDSSHRFERGVDPEIQCIAIERATQLILSICGGQVGPVVEKKNEKAIPRNHEILLRNSQINRILGMDLDAKFVNKTFKKLGMKCVRKEDTWRITPPSYRFDIQIEADLIEELARTYGYDLIPVSIPSVELSMKSDKKQTANKLREILINRDYQEIITYSFVDPNLHYLLNKDEVSLSLINPIAPELSDMRVSLLPGLISSLQRNVKRQRERVRLFEVGLVFSGNKKESQDCHIGGIIYGNTLEKQWDKNVLLSDFYDVKCDIEVLLSECIDTNRIEFTGGNNQALHPGQRADVYIDTIKVGYFGQLHPGISSSLGFVKNVFVFELNVELLSKKKQINYKKISKFPTISRDISLLVDEQVQFNEILESVQKSAPEHLIKLELFDLYRGKGIEKGKKSMALGLTFQSIRSTLKDEEVDNNMHKLIKGLSDRLNAKLRE